MSPAVSDDGTLKEDSALKRWNNLLVEATDKLGASLRSPGDYKQQLADAGYQNVTLREYKWPTNPWPKDPKHKEIGQTIPHKCCVLFARLTRKQVHGPRSMFFKASRH